ncbi:MAG: DUF4968 domain-containing protein [Bacteroidales bacterium]|nr:DUF4968 domain-containing protein [Bacteroidales bacterium]
MNNLRLCLLLCVMGFLAPILKAQILAVLPQNPVVDDTITLTYDAGLGNGELAANSSDVYIYTGVITNESSSLNDWKHVVSGWCENPVKTKMTPLGNDRYQIRFHIRSFYDLSADEIVLKLACLFVNADCSKVGREVGNADIFYPVASDISGSDYLSSWLQHDTLIISCTEGEISITPYGSNIIQLFSGIPGSENEASYATVGVKTNVSVHFSREEKFLKFSTDSIQVLIDTTNLHFAFVCNSDTVLQAGKLYNFQSSGTLQMELKSGERIYGAGSRAISMDRRGKVLSINNQAHYGYGFGAKDLNIALPVFTSSAGYGLFIDNHALASLDVGGMQAEKLSYTFTGGQAEVFFIAGSNYGVISNQFTNLTGRQPLPPIWALGYIQSKFGYENEAEATNIINSIRAADFPLDALVLDLYWFGSPATMGNLSWDNSRFPQPATMMAGFRNKGVKTILISEPYFTQSSSNFAYADTHHLFGENLNGNSYIINGFWAGNAALLDLFNPAAQEWLWPFYRSRTSEGVSGWWSDLGEPESHPPDMVHVDGQSAGSVHNVFSLVWEKLMFDRWRADFPNQRLFNLSRSGFTGMQRYAAFPWSGDVQRSFEGLQAQIPIMLSMGLGGVGYMHSDVGGFTGGTNDDELFTRWVQMGVFAPVFRIHGTGIETAPVAYSQQTQQIVRKYIQLRYRLLPYIYSLAYENTTTGAPLARPMDYHEPRNASLQNINDQIFFGDAFLIAPVLYRGQTQRNVTLPAGHWIDYNNKRSFSGPGTITMAAPIGEIPVFVKAGSFIPTTALLTTTDNYHADTLFVQYFPDAESPFSSYTLFDDDKTSPISLEADAYQLIHFFGDFDPENTTISISSTGNGYVGMPASRQLVFELYRIDQSPETVTLNDAALSNYASYSEFMQHSGGTFYDQDKLCLYVQAPFAGENAVIRISGLSVNALPEGHAEPPMFRLSPNPGKDELVIEALDSKMENALVLVHTVDGKILKRLDMKCDKPMTLNTTQWAEGLYLIQLQSSRGSSTLKWVKE